MLIRKTAGFFLAALLLAASALGILAAFPSRGAAADAPATLTTETASLFLPESYENYLELSSPSSVAIGKRYVAIADGKKIYIYDRLEPSKGYRVWEHKKDTEGVTVGKMQFTDDDRLFFSSVSGLFELTLEESLSERQVSSDFIPYTFLIAENTLYVVTAIDGSNTVLYRFEMNGESFVLANAKGTMTVSDSSSPQRSPLLAYAGGTVYCSLNGTVYKYDGETLGGGGNFSLDSAASSMRTPSSICAIGDSLYFTNDAGLYRADMNGKAELIEHAENISALYPRGNLLYCLYGKAVRAYDTATATFTDYEISSSSDSVNRLNGAKDIVRAGGLLVTADTNNNRISVYDMQKQSYTVISLDFAPIFAATDGTLVAAADAHTIQVFACDYKGIWQSKQTFTLSQSNDTLEGIVCEFEQVYYVSEHYHGNLETSVLNNGTPAGLAANLYGDLFVAYQDGKVKRFTEKTFTQGGNGKEINITLPGDFSCLRADFEGNLYYLNENGELCRNGEEQSIAKIDATKYVYTEADRSPVSFALGYEDDEVYFCFGDFIVKSNAGALSELETLEKLSQKVLTAAEGTLGTPQDAENVLLADCNPGAVGIHGDLSALREGGAFAAGYNRYTEARRGVLLVAQDDYSLVAVYENHVYTAEIFRNEDLGEPFAPEKKDGEGATMYLSSDCPAYHFPCILGAPARAGVLARGTKVTVLSYIDEGGGEAAQGGYSFAYVEYETAARSGEPARCYVPTSYLTDVDPLGDAGENYTLGYVKPGATFTGSDGNQIVTEERVQARLYQNEDGTYTATYEKDGVTYTATVEEAQIEWGESDAWRIALIIILSVLALVIIGGYVFLLPWNKKRNK